MDSLQPENSGICITELAEMNSMAPARVKQEPVDPDSSDPMVQLESIQTDSGEDSSKISLEQESSNSAWKCSVPCTFELGVQRNSGSPVDCLNPVDECVLTKIKVEPSSTAETIGSHKDGSKEDWEGKLRFDDIQSGTVGAKNAPFPVAIFQNQSEAERETDKGDNECMNSPFMSRTVEEEGNSTTRTVSTNSHKTTDHSDMYTCTALHEGGLALVCRMCDYKTDRKDVMVKHIRKHTGERPYKCSQCEYRSSNKSALVVHMRSHTGEKPYKCSHCEYSASRKAYLVTHLRTHTGEKPYKCSHCEFSTRQRANLDAHLRTHTGEKSHKCPFCDYASAVKINLTRHVRIHTGEKPYKCTHMHCDYSSSQKRRLVEHLKMHSGDRPHKCSVCEYTAIRKADIIAHMKTHTGEKPHKCSYCAYSCRRKTNLVAHTRRHTGEKPYVCSVCNCSFTYHNSLSYHMTLHHMKPQL